MNARAKYDEADVILNGHCCGEGCGAYPTRIFRVSQYRYRCAVCYQKETGNRVPFWMEELAHAGVRRDGRVA